MTLTSHHLPLHPAFHIRPVSAAAFALLVGWTGAVAAQESPYYLGVTQSFTSDSNIARAPKGAEKRETISSTGLRAGVDQPFGQQRLNLTAEAGMNRYATTSRLNNTNYALTGRLDWATIENISGSLSLESRQALNLLDLSAAQVGLLRNIQRTNGYSLYAQKGGVTLLTLDAGLSGSQTSSSEASLRNREFRQQTLSAGVRYAPTPISSVRLGVRHTAGRYPYYSATQEDKIKRNDIDLSGTYELSGLSKLNARVSYTKEDHSVSNLRGTSGLTGALGWNWKPSGKLGVDVQLARDTNVGTQSQFGLLTNTTSNDSLVRDSLSVRSTWEISAFINLNASLGYSRRTLDNAFYDATTNSFNGGRDHTTTASLGVSYTPLRNIVLGCGLNWESRGVDSAGLTTTTFAYGDTSVNCYGQAYLR